MNLNISKLLNQVSYELKALELARQKYKKQLAPNFSIFNYKSLLKSKQVFITKPS